MIDFSNVALMTKRIKTDPGYEPVFEKSAISKKVAGTINYLPPKLLEQELNKKCPVYELT
jgi:hypothetical protein